MKNVSDVIVVGAGVIGLMTARELVSAGCSVTVFDSGAIGMGSSQAGGGILSPVPPWDAPPAARALADASYDGYPELARALYERTEIDIEYIQSGLLLLGAKDDAVIADWAQQSGQQYVVLDPRQVKQREPGLSDHWSSAVLLPGLGQLRNPRLTRALQRDLELSGVRLLQQTAVQQIISAGEGDRVTGVRTEGEDYFSDNVVIAAGAWTSQLLAEYCAAAIEPVRGQMLWYEMAPGTFKHVVVDDEHYLIPRRDGVCLVGSTVEAVGFDAATTTSAAERLQAVAARLSPVMADRRPAGQWSGLRPGRPGGIPLISSIPGVKGLIINAGHFRNGINLAPASARLAADLVLGRQSVLDSGPYTLTDHL